MVQQQFYLALGCLVGGVVIALFPSNYEIVGMEGIEIDSGDSENEKEPKT
jgi:hypothetical protein